MISARFPDNLVERMDFVVRNPPTPDIKNRSTALQTAVEAWLPGQEAKLQELGILPKKTR